SRGQGRGQPGTGTFTAAATLFLRARVMRASASSAQPHRPWSSPMSLVVQKYGGSSVADADAIKRVAARIAETRRAGNDVVVTVSAMGDTTDELIDLATAVSGAEHPREMDILLTAGERISMSLLAMAVRDLG